MSFTIITVALNAADVLPATLESVLAQDFGHVETILVDGTSWDRTPAVLDAYRGEVDRIVTTFDAGVFHAMNEAVRLASNEYVLFMNAGDRFYAADTLSTVWARRHGNPDILYGDHLHVTDGRATLTRSGDFAALRETLRGGILSREWHSRIPAHQATFTRTALLKEVGYDTAYEICADHAFMFTAFERGARFQYIDEIVALYAGGGLSARRTMRCRLEFCALYRRFSHYPALVDGYFYGETPPPFPPTSPMTGAILSGVFPREGAGAAAGGADPAAGLAWCAGEGIGLAAPQGERVHALVLEGYNPRPDQDLELFHDGAPIGRHGLPHGPFAIEIAFSHTLAPGSVVECRPRHGHVLDEAGGRYVSFALGHFHFLAVERTPPPRLKPGRTAFNSRDKSGARFLSHGWGVLEPTHVWSVVPEAELAFEADAPAESLVLAVRSNPFLGEPQTITVELNGTVVATRTLEGHGEITAPVAEAWRTLGTNTLRLGVSKTARPPEDPRSLGLALEHVTVLAPAEGRPVDSRGEDAPTSPGETTGESAGKGSPQTAGETTGESAGGAVPSPGTPGTPGREDEAAGRDETPRTRPEDAA